MTLVRRGRTGLALCHAGDGGGTRRCGLGRDGRPEEPAVPGTSASAAARAVGWLPWPACTCRGTVGPCRTGSVRLRAGAGVPGMAGIIGRVRGGCGTVGGRRTRNGRQRAGSVDSRPRAGRPVLGSRSLPVHGRCRASCARYGRAAGPGPGPRLPPARCPGPCRLRVCRVIRLPLVPARPVCRVLPVARGRPRRLRRRSRCRWSRGRPRCRRGTSSAGAARQHRAVPARRPGSAGRRSSRRQVAVVDETDDALRGKRPLYSWAFTEKFGSESPPIVYSVPSAYFVTTSTCPSNSTQSPGCGWYPSPSGCHRPCACASWSTETMSGEDPGSGRPGRRPTCAAATGTTCRPVTQLCWPTTCAASSSVRLANAAQDSPWSTPSMLSCCQMIASISAGVLPCAIRR